MPMFWFGFTGFTDTAWLYFWQQVSTNHVRTAFVSFLPTKVTVLFGTYTEAKGYEWEGCSPFFVLVIYDR